MNTQLELDIIEDYKENTIKQIQEKYHLSYYSIVKIFDKYKIEHSRKTKNNSQKNIRILTEEEKNIVYETYLRTKKISECEKAISAGQDVIRRCLKEKQIYRTHRQAMEELPQNQRKYPVKDDYFEYENNEMAYLLGFLASDGTVRKNTNEIKLSLSSIDEDFLNDCHLKIGGKPIKTYQTQDGFSVSTWSFTSKKIKEKLEYYNIVPQKTFTFKFPMNLNKTYWKDFIRGYFDGDGCISTAGKKAIRFSICSATQDVLEKIILFFEENGIPRVNIQKYKNKNVYYFQYSTNATKQIYSLLYYPNCWCLKRKQKKYQDLINN